MLGSIRKRTGSLLVKGLLGLLVVSFALWGIGDIFQGPRDRAVATVGGAGISASALQVEYTRAVENLRREFGMDAEQARALGALENALERLIDREAVRQEADAIGIGAPDSEVLRAIENNSAFHNVAGRFDRAVYNTVLYRNSFTAPAYEAVVREDVRSAQLVETLAVGAHAPRAATLRLLRHERQERTAQALTLFASDETAPDPAESDLLAWFSERRAEYTAPEYRRVSFVAMRPGDFLDRVDASEEELREDYEYRIAEFVTPTRRALDQLVFPAREEADAAFERARAGEDFHALGAALLGLSASDMDLGVLTEDEMASGALGAAAFGTPVGETAAPVETPFGWTLLRVRSETPGETRTFEDAIETLRLERKIILAQNVAADLGDEFEDARAGGATLEEAARAVGAAPETVGPIDRLGRPAPGAAETAPPAIAEFLERAFAAAEGEESPLYDADDGTYYALRVDSIAPPAEKPLDAVRGEALADWKEEWRRTRAADRAAIIAVRLRAGETPEEIAADTGAALFATPPFRRSSAAAGENLGTAFVAAAFALPPDGVSDPIAEGDRVHVAKLASIVDIDEDAIDENELERIAGQLISGQIGDILEGYLDRLRRERGVAIDAGAIARFFEN